MHIHRHLVWPVLVTIGYLFLMHLRGLNGQLLSDSFSLIYTCHSWQQADQMGHQLLSLFYRSTNEAGGSFMFRPLAIAALCGDYILWGEQAFAHKLIQLLWHLGNGILLFVLLIKVCRFYQLNPLFATVTACLFLVSHLTPEVSVWVAGRFDVMVQTFMFLCLYTYWAHKRFWALFFLVLALFSKESAMVIVPILISLSFFRQYGQPGAFKAISRECGLFIVLLVLYLIYRWIIFGQTSQVYPQDGSLFERILSHTQTFPVFLWRTVFAAVDQIILSWLYLLLILGLWIYSLYSAYRHQLLRLWFFTASGIVIVLLALLTQVGSGESSGTGARLLYIVIPWLMALLSLPLLFKRERYHRVAMTVFLLLTVLMHCWVVQQWTTASQVSKKIINRVPELAQSVDQDNWSLLLVPDHIGAALLARNAQGAMVMPPFQRRPYIDAVVPFVWYDLNLWYARVNNQFVLKNNRRPNHLNPQPQWAFCYTQGGEFIRSQLSDNIFESKSAWRSFWENMVIQNKCYH